MRQFLAFVLSRDFNVRARCDLCKAGIRPDSLSFGGHFFGPEEPCYLGIMEEDVLCSGCFDDLSARMKAFFDRAREEND